MNTPETLGNRGARTCAARDALNPSGELVQCKVQCTPGSALFTVRDLVRHFGGNAAVDGVSFDVAAGEIVALIGPNGAGKSTVFNLLGGQLAADQGSVRLDGRQLLGMAPHHVARLGVGRTFQIAAPFASLSVVENVQTALLAQSGKSERLACLWRNARRARRQQALELLAQVELRDQADRPCGALAYGDVKRLELAVALAAAPRLLLMDEPTAGMAPSERRALMALVQRLARQRKLAVLFTEHSMDVVFAHADRIAVMARGRIIAQGGADAVRNDARVRAVYFGSGAAVELRQAESSHPDPVRLLGAATAAVTRCSAGDAPIAQTVDFPLLEVTRLNAWYGGAHILHDVTLSVARGEAVALMGRNGAGKSTTLKAMMGMIAQCSGARRFLAMDLTRRAPYQLARAGLGYVPEDRRVFTELSVRENLLTARQPARRWPDGVRAPHWTLERLYALFPHLASLDRRLAGQLSGGEQQMLTVARTLMGNPLLILLDEPSEGVAPIVVEQMIHMIQTLKAEGVSILLSEQNLPFAARICERAYVLEKGAIRHAGATADLMHDDDTLRAYLSI